MAPTPRERAATKSRLAKKRIFVLTGGVRTALALDRISRDVRRVAVDTANIGRVQFLDLVARRTLSGSYDTGALFESIGVVQPVRGVIGRAIRTTISNYQLITSGGLDEIGTVSIGDAKAPYAWYAHAHAAEESERFWWGNRGGGSSPLRDMRHLYGEQIYDAVGRVVPLGSSKLNGVLPVRGLGGLSAV